MRGKVFLRRLFCYFPFTMLLAAPGSATAQNYQYQAEVLFDQGLYAQALSIYQQQAQQGNAWAQAKLGTMYLRGLGVCVDYTQAMNWYQQAASQGNAEAQNDIGVMYMQGAGVGRDFAQAAAWFQKSASQGYSPAETNLGNSYQMQWGEPQDYSQAFSWFQKAAQAGDPLGMSKLGIMYSLGQGTSVDKSFGLALEQKASERGLDNPPKDSLYSATPLTANASTCVPAPAPAPSAIPDTSEPYIPTTNPRDAVSVSAFVTSDTTNGRPNNSVWVQYQNNNDYNVSAHSVTTYVCGGKSIQLEDTELVLAHQSTKQWLDTCFSINIPGGQQNDGIASNINVRLTSVTQQ